MVSEKHTIGSRCRPNFIYLDNVAQNTKLSGYQLDLHTVELNQPDPRGMHAWAYNLSGQQVVLSLQNSPVTISMGTVSEYSLTIKLASTGHYLPVQQRCLYNEPPTLRRVIVHV